MDALSDLPRELVIGWTFWVVGGLLLTLWFVRQSASTRDRPVPSQLHTGSTTRLSGTHAVARPLSGTHAAARAMSGTHTATRRSAVSRPLPAPSGGPAPAAGHGADVFDELRTLLDSQDDPPRA